MGAQVGVEGEVIASVLAIFVCLPILSFSFYYFVCLKCFRKSTSKDAKDLHFPSYITPGDSIGTKLMDKKDDHVTASTIATPATGPQQESKAASPSSSASSDVPRHHIHDSSPSEPVTRKSMFGMGMASVKVSPLPVVSLEPLDLEQPAADRDQEGSLIFAQEGNHSPEAKREVTNTTGKKSWHKNYDHAPKQISIVDWLFNRRSPSYRKVKVGSPSQTASN